MNTKRKLAALTTCLVASCVLAACGSSSTSSSTTKSAAATGGTATRSKFETCMKQHGVTVGVGRGGAAPGRRFAPGSGPPAGGGFFGGGGAAGAGGGVAGRFRLNPKTQAAFKACGADFPARRFSAVPRRTLITRFVTCVNQHGYKLPKPNLSGKGAVFPAKIASNPKFVSASRACRSVLTPGPAGAPGAAGPGPPPAQS